SIAADLPKPEAVLMVSAHYTTRQPLVATSAKHRSDGTGLGLPLTKALVEANRAAFQIDSAVGQGTLIRVTFPATRVLAG
ncbi:MAG: hypothetical protein J0H20_17580, partial [Rhizobiales bacterium]|nr:hypothetical protein [Hyphomicrobiales bacterium]